MAINKQVYQKHGSNAAQIDANFDWATAHRWRMTDLELGQYGSANVLRIINNGTADARISFTFDVARTHSFTIKAGKGVIWNVEDGIKFIGFDVYSEDAAVNLAIGDIQYNIMWIKEIPEVAV